MSQPSLSPSASVAELVQAAIRGVPGSFDRLVLRFQDMAVGTAYGWLRDLSQAEDAAQEAFAEVHRNLDRIEDPAAFPGFLRRVVRKHCDRRTRRTRRELAVPDPEAAAPGPGADAALGAAEDRARVRAAVEALPAEERLVVALHYLAGLPQPEVASWLGVPLSTVKKRLYTARGRLRDAMEDDMNETFEAMRPSRSSQFSDTLRLFLAVREGDVECVRGLLERRPELVEAEERWDDELTRAHALPVPNGGTPLVRAAQRNHLAMIDLLLEHGAAVDRACPCPGGESPLWAAVASGQLEAARRLLARGANPDHASFAAHTPLHVAALRGYDEIVDLLCEYGADGTRRDEGGRTPADWAREKGHAAAVERLAARFGDAGRVERRAPSARSAPCETGIKALDLFAPIFPGSLGSARFDAGLGAVVFLAELSARWRRRAGSGGPAVVWVGWERQPVDRSEMEHAFAELDLRGDAVLVWSPASDDVETRRGTMARAIREARAMRERGVASPLLIAFAQPGRRAEVEAALPELANGGDSLTAIVAERYGDPGLDRGPLRPPFDLRISFDPALAGIAHFPALHPLWSASAGLAPERVGEAHCRIAARARDLLQRHRAIDPDLGLSGEGAARDLAPDERRDVARGRRLQAYLTQPFEVAEPFTGRPARGPALAETLADVEAILAGSADDLEPEELAYRGALSELGARAPGPQTRR